MTETNSKIRRLVACLAIGESPDEAGRMLSMAEQFAKRGDYPLVSPEDIAKLYHPHEPDKRPALAQQVQRYIAQGLLPCRVANLTTVEALAIWPNRPAIAPGHPLADVLPPGPPPIERRKLAALKREVRGRWPSVESDFRHADENGLKATAKLPDQHGDWDLNAALRWARERGKLTDTAAHELDPLEAFNRRPRR
jgi:hypothetical protein